MVLKSENPPTYRHEHHSKFIKKKGLVTIYNAQYKDTEHPTLNVIIHTDERLSLTTATFILKKFDFLEAPPAAKILH